MTAAHETWVATADPVTSHGQESSAREALVSLFRRLRTFKVTWDAQKQVDEYGPLSDRSEQTLEHSDVVSSAYKFHALGMDRTAELMVSPRHVVALDLDVPAYLVPSTTPGHSHLYIEAPDGIPHETYMRLLDVLAEAGVIEPGYASVSKERGHTDLRLPWVKKEQA